MSLNDAVGALLELSNEQEKVLNKHVSDFVFAVKSEELKNAYVTTDSSGNEEIIIKAFDSTKLISNFQTNLSLSFDPTITKFVIGLAEYDGVLKSLGSEVHLAYEVGTDGENRLRVDSEILSRQADPAEEAYVKDGIIFSSKIKVSSSQILGKNGNPRYQLLFDKVASLPRTPN